MCGRTFSTTLACAALTWMKAAGRSRGWRFTDAARDRNALTVLSMVPISSSILGRDHVGTSVGYCAITMDSAVHGAAGSRW